eukprot:6202444-Pleurochrysis_carterae.AAC.2
MLALPRRAAGRATQLSRRACIAHASMRSGSCCCCTSEHYWVAMLLFFEPGIARTCVDVRQLEAYGDQRPAARVVGWSLENAALPMTEWDRGGLQHWTRPALSSPRLAVMSHETHYSSFVFSAPTCMFSRRSVSLDTCTVASPAARVPNFGCHPQR